MSLREGVRQWVLQNVPYDRNDASLVAYLNGLDAHGLLAVFHNWMSRLVKPQRRTVHRSKAFQQNSLTVQRTADLAQIVDDIEHGRNLSRYLSRDITRAAVRIPGQGRRPDLDLMLNDWGVHHLHISTQVEPDGFVKRDGPLLFVSFQPANAYLIDIMGHGDWTRDHVLQVLATEWPKAGVIHEIKGAMSLAHPLTEADRAVLRKKHINSFFEFNGKVYSPNGFMSAAGFSMHATREADRLLDRIDAFEHEFARNSEWLKATFEQHGLTWPSNPNFEFAIREDGPGVIETNTRAWINLMNLTNE